MLSEEQLIDTGSWVLEQAKAAGADEADTVVAYNTDFEVKVADGKIVNLTEATAKGVGVRVFVDGRLGFCTTSDFGRESLATAVQQAVLFAKEAAADPHNGIPQDLEAEVPTTATADLDLFDSRVVDLPTDEKIRWAHALEEAARAVDPRVSKFRDSGVASGMGTEVLLTSGGALRCMRGTGISLWSSPVVQDPQTGDLQTEVWYDSRTHLEDLDSVESIGHRAAQRAVRMLGAKPVATQRVPVIFENHMAVGLVAGLLSAIDGDMVYKKTSFLAHKLGEQVAASGITLVDDPSLARAVGSAAYDGEGRPTYRKNLIDRGTLTMFLYDTYTARKAGANPTASAQRSYAGLPHVGTFNIYVEPGDADPADILSSSPQALLVTSAMGSGVNPVTGEYSRGVSGLWLEQGEVVHPVQAVTIAGDYLQMLGGIDAVGNDLVMRGSSGAPTLRVAEMTLSGQT